MSTTRRIAHRFEIRDPEKDLLGRATSNAGYHYNGEGRFFILLGQAFAVLCSARDNRLPLAEVATLYQRVGRELQPLADELRADLRDEI